MTEPVSMMKCPDCDNFSEPGETLTLYECGNCGTVFTQDGSADGASNRCPDCNKFAAKKTDDGCPECEEGECEAVMAHQEDGEWVEDSKAEVTPARPVVAALDYDPVALPANRLEILVKADSPVEPEWKPITRSSAFNSLIVAGASEQAATHVLAALEDGSMVQADPGPFLLRGVPR